MSQRLAALFLTCAIAVSAIAADAPRFRPASDSEPAVGRYLVALAADDVEGGMTSDLLARTYGGRLEPFANDGLSGAMILMVMRPAQARALSNDPRVLWVEERPSEFEQRKPVSPVVAPASPPPVAPSVTAARDPRTNWEVSNNSWSSGAYQYDGAGNIQKIGDDIYRYDRFGRLAKATAATALVAPGTTPVNEQNFSYDIYGNLTSLTTRTSTGTMRSGFAVNTETNQLNGPCPGGADLCLNGIYDPAGSGHQLGNTQPDQYTWDALGMMTELNDRRYERYVYDANDERILTVDTTPRPASTETHRRYSLRGLDSKVLRELTHTLSTNTWSAARDYIYRGGSLIASFSSASVEDPDRHFHTDHLGSTRLVTDGTGQRLAVHTYWPFGREADGSQTDGERMKFTGHERDGAGSGFELDYMHARYYDANLGRFLSVDPGNDWDLTKPQSWNAYSYVRNNPMSNSDPTGRWTLQIGLTFGGNAYGGAGATKWSLTVGSDKKFAIQRSDAVGIAGGWPPIQGGADLTAEFNTSAMSYSDLTSGDDLVIGANGAFLGEGALDLGFSNGSLTSVEVGIGLGTPGIAGHIMVERDTTLWSSEVMVNGVQAFVRNALDSATNADEPPDDEPSKFDFDFWQFLNR